MVLGVAAVLLISWELMVIFVVVLGCECWMLVLGGLLDEVDDLLVVVYCCWLYLW